MKTRDINQIKCIKDGTDRLLVKDEEIMDRLRECVESLGILCHTIVALLQSQELGELPADNPYRNMVCSKSFLELIPRKPSASKKHGHVVVPPRTRGTPELLCCKSSLVIIIVWVQGKL